MGIVIRTEEEGVSSYDTNDFNMTAYLLSKGYEMIGMHPHKRSMVYHFVISETIEKAVEEYWDDEKKNDMKHINADCKGLNGHKNAN